MKNRYFHDNDEYPRGEIAILCGIIRTAIIDYRRDATKYADKYWQSRRGKTQRDAEAWLFKSSYRGPGSLLWICDLLGLNANEIRKKALTCDLKDIAACQRQQEARA